MNAIFEAIISLMTKENITFAAAVLGGVGAVRSYIRQRRRIVMKICKISNTDSGFFVRCLIKNTSNLPISITSIGIIEDRHKLPSFSFCDPKPVPLANSDSSAQFPVTLQALEATVCWIGFPIPDKSALVSPTQVSFVLHTTRGKINKKSLQLSEVPHVRRRTS